MYLCISGAVFVAPYSFGYLVPFYISPYLLLTHLKEPLLKRPGGNSNKFDWKKGLYCIL
jgi:hypothetical protein